MTIKSAALRTSSLVALGTLVLADMALSHGTAIAAQAKPLGALDINLGGKLRWYSFFGDLKDKAGGNSGNNPGTYDFRTDTEVYVYARGKDEATGLEYGGNVEFEADTNNSTDTDESFLFIKGKFGEFRLGDQNGVTEQMIVGAVPLATFSGGVDGVGPIDAGALAYGFNSGDSTKLAYYSPVISGFQLGVSLTPSTSSSGSDIKTTQGSTNIQDLVEPGLTYKNKFGDFGVLAGVTGAIGRFASNSDESRDFNQVYGGFDLTYANFSFGGGLGRTKGARPFSTAAGDAGSVNSTYIGAFVVDPGSKQTFYNLGAAATFGPTTISLNYGQTVSSTVADGTPDGKDPEPKYVNLGLSYGLAPGLAIGGEVIYFNNSDNTANNDGVLGLAGVKLAF